MKRTFDKRGFTLFYAVLVASLLLAIGIAIFNITFKELVLSSGARESESAFYSADTGLECALFWDLKHNGLSAPAFGFYGDSLSSGLGAYWRFSEGTGVDTADSSGNGNTGTLKNFGGVSGWTTGHNGNALLFDGVDDYVSTPDIDYTNQMSGSLWAKFTLVANQQMILSQGATPEVQLQMQGSVGSQKFRIRVDAGSGADIVDSTTAAIPGTWYHLAWTYDGTDVHLYVNGIQETNWIQNTGSGNIKDVNENYGIGARNTAALPTGGIIDDVRIYERVLSGAEISKIYQGQPNNMFVAPVAQGSNALCNNADITSPATGWDALTGWTVTTSGSAATTTFDLLFDNGKCATVQVSKNTSTTTIVSRGYNTCTLSDPRRVERAIRATY